MGDYVVLDAANDGAGTPPNTGLVWGVGRHQVTFLTHMNLVGTAKVRVVNVTDNTEVAVRTITPGAAVQTNTLAFDGVAAKAYQAQVVVTARTSGLVQVHTITREVLPALASTEQIRTDPGGSKIDRLDSSGNLSGYLAGEGEVPCVLWPGTNILSLRADEIALALYSENQSVRTRTPAVTLTYSPRYAL